MNQVAGKNRRYIGIIVLLLLMMYIHLYIILIHPLLFIIWPLSYWLITEIKQEWKGDKRLFLFITAFIGYTVVTQLLVVEHTIGILFTQEPTPNMGVLSNTILVLSTGLYLYDTFLSKNQSHRTHYTYIGFASVIPWLAPAIIEALILLKWSHEGSFPINTLGKGIGAASIHDILFHYGFKNLVITTLISTLVYGVKEIRKLIKERKEKTRIREKTRQEREEWIQYAWKNPLNLLTRKDQKEFITKYGKLEPNQKNRILREKILPRKGIILKKPEN